MKFDNVQQTTPEARAIALPLGDKVVTFYAKHLDVRSTSYLRIRGMVQKPYRRLIEAEKLDDVTDRKLSVTAFVKSCLVNWEGVTSNGEPVPYSEDVAIEFFMQSPPLFYDLLTEASTRDNYLPSEDDGKN